MSERWFHVIYFADPAIQICLDAVVLLANPAEKDSAHITFRGPVANQPGEDENYSELSGTEVAIVGVGKFFEKGQNTVYLSCGSEMLKKVWKKADFSFNPHITLYDGPSRGFAERLHAELSAMRLYFKLRLGKPVAIKSMSGQKSFGLWFGFDPKSIQDVVGEELSLSDIKAMEDWKRLMLIGRLANRLIWLSSKSSEASLTAVRSHAQ